MSRYKYRVRYLPVSEGRALNIEQYPNFDCNGSISGMKDKYYGKDSTLVRCGSYIYKVPMDIYLRGH